MAAYRAEPSGAMQRPAEEKAVKACPFACVIGSLLAALVPKRAKRQISLPSTPYR